MYIRDAFDEKLYDKLIASSVSIKDKDQKATKFDWLLWTSFKETTINIEKYIQDKLLSIF